MRCDRVCALRQAEPSEPAVAGARWQEGKENGDERLIMLIAVGKLKSLIFRNIPTANDRRGSSCQSGAAGNQSGWSE